MNVRAYLQSLEQFGIKLGLDQIRALVEHLGRPHDEFRSIVVAGTNGKGSVTAMIERALREAGYRTGRYISPHLVALEERFAVNGRAVDSGVLDRALGHVRDAAETPARIRPATSRRRRPRRSICSATRRSRSPCSRSASAAGWTRRTS